MLYILTVNSYAIFEVAIAYIYYFLLLFLIFYIEDKKYRGKCEYTLVNNGIEETSMRKLDAFDVLIRDPKVSTIT